MFPGMPVRLQNDIRKRYDNDILKGDENRVRKIRINVEAPVHRNNNVFLGASVLADLMKLRDDFWISRLDYEEIGVERAMSNIKM
jgi:actin-related protein 2